MFVSLDKIRIPLCEEVTANAEAGKYNNNDDDDDDDDDNNLVF